MRSGFSGKPEYRGTNADMFGSEPNINIGERRKNMRVQ